jgi:signal transduction histidine kinase
LVEDLRTISLAEAGQLRLKPQATDLKGVSWQVIEGFQTQLASKNINVGLEAPENLPQAWADPDRTAQVLRNLLSNAFHYTPEGGRITVRLASEADGVTVSVTDTGPGIPPEDLPRIFDRFYRVDRSRTRSTGGSGLGLAIVKQLVEAQGGSVWADSVMGKGSTFTFRLPRSP